MDKRLTHKQRILFQNKENILKCYQGGASLREVADWFDTHTNSVRQLLKEAGILIRPPGRKPDSCYTGPKQPKKSKRAWTDRQGLSSGSVYNKKLKEAKSRVVDWLSEKYRNVPCMDCGNIFDWCAMDFDHRPGETKEIKIGSIGQRRASTKLKEKIELEITKCDLICACCHRVRTKQRKEGKYETYCYETTASSGRRVYHRWVPTRIFHSVPRRDLHHLCWQHQSTPARTGD